MNLLLRMIGKSTSVFEACALFGKYNEHAVIGIDRRDNLEQGTTKFVLELLRDDGELLEPATVNAYDVIGACVCGRGCVQIMCMCCVSSSRSWCSSGAEAR